MKPRRPQRAVTGVLLLDKPAGLSSNAALQVARRLFQAEKAGHTGSLDPLATGLLPICFGQATKLCGYLLDSDKRYTVTGKLGEKTETGDAEGQVTANSDPSTITRAQLLALLPRFTGEIAQVPPMYSALRHEGQRLYEIARRGEEVPREPRPVRIHELSLTGYELPFFDLDLRCSKGTYVRTLVEDLAAAAGQCAHVTRLRRLEAGPFRSQPMVSMDAVEQAAAGGLTALDALLLPAASALAHWPQLRLDADRAFYLARGEAVRIAAAPKSGLVALLAEDGGLLGVGEINSDGLVAPKRWMS